MYVLDIVYRYTGIVAVNSTRYDLTRSRPYEKTFKKHLTHLLLRDNIQSQQTNRHNKTEEEKMLAYVNAIVRENTITVDGYTTNKTERGIIKDAARAIEKYDKEEAKALLSFLEYGIDEYNTPFAKATNSDGGYFFEYEEVPCATKYNEKTDEAEYKKGYHNYFCIRFVR